MSNGQAKRGGEQGVNGEFYAGGQFLPSTEAPKRHRPAKPAGKQQTAPYVWELAPTPGARAIWGQIVGWVHRAGSSFEPFEPAFAAARLSSEQDARIRTLIGLYAVGARWIDAD